MKIEWHVDAIKDLKSISTGDLRRIRKAVDELAALDDPRQRLVPYSGNLKGFWKLRIGNFRLVCQIREQDGVLVLIVRVAHRSTIYDLRGVEEIKKR